MCSCLLRAAFIRYGIALMATVCLAAPLLAIREGEGSEISSELRHAEIDWQRGRLTIRLEAEIPDELATHPGSEYRVQRRLEREAEGLYLDAVHRLQLNSSGTAEIPLDRDAELTNDVRRAAVGLERRYTGPSADLRRTAVELSIDIHPTLTRVFAPHARSRPVPEVPGWHPSGAFTGVVIYATEALPVHGEPRNAVPVPALLPRLHDDERFEVVFEPSMVEPEYLQRWGPVGYTQPGREGQVLERVGHNPLQILASAVFGTDPTDLMIPRQDALRLLAREENRRLLAEGRVVIVLQPDRTHEVLVAE